MRVEEIELVGNTRFNTEVIKSFRWAPQASLSLILGNNGSGKSSLLDATNPLPGIKDDYLPGGFKRFVCVYRDVRYILVSDFTQGQTHSFKRIVDGIEEELNESGTVTVQKELAKTIFGYDQKLHELLTGQTRFTELSPAARKELLMSISPLQLEYANSLFDKTKVMLRDDQGIVKHLAAKAQDLDDKLAAIDIKEDQDTITYLENMVNKLLPFKGSKEVDLEDLWNTISSLMTSIESGYTHWKKWDGTVRLGNKVKNVDELNYLIGSLESDLSNSILSMQELTKKSMELTQVIDQLDSEQLTKDEIVDRLNQINAQLSKMEKSENFIRSDRVVTGQQIVLDMSQRVDYSFPTEQIFYSDSMECKRVSEDYEAKKVVVLRGKQYRQSVLDKIEHLEKDSQTIVCPRCTLNLSISGVDIETELKRLREELVRVDEKLASLEKELEEIAVHFHQVDAIMGIRARLTDIVNQYYSDPLLQSFWAGFQCTERSELIEVIIQNKTAFLSACMQFREYLVRCEQYNRLAMERDKYQVVLDQYQLLGLDVGNDYHILQERIHGELQKQEVLEKDIQYYKQSLKMFNHFLYVTERCEGLLETVFKTFNEWVDGTIQSDARARLDEIYGRLGSIKHLVNQKEVLQSSLIETRNELSIVKERHSDLDILQLILSPNKGIVADQMLGFINSFIEQINKIIEQIWLQPLELVYWSMDRGTIDYKFPVRNESQTRDDIKECSKGQKELIDMAFIFVMRQYLGIQDYPVYFDETGDGFDQAHKNQLLKFIKGLIETQQCQQIFMINHYADWHGALANHETVVLDNRNIVVPSTYNQNVTING